MKRPVADLSLDEERAHHIKRRQAPQVDAEELAETVRDNQPGETVEAGGFVTLLQIGENEVPISPYDRLLQASIKKEADRRAKDKDKEAANLAALISERVASRSAREAEIQTAFQQLTSLKRYVESLTKVDHEARQELIGRLKYKNKVRENFLNQSTGLRDQKTKKLAEESMNHTKEKKNEIEAKHLLNEILKVQQNLDDVDKKIEKLKREREERKVKMQQDELVLRKAQEKEEIKKRLETLVQRVAEKNKLFSKEYLSVRVLNEQVSRIKHHTRVLAVLVPKETVVNPFHLQSYLKVSKHHRSLAVVPNDKLQNPEKYTLSDLDERVGNVEEYAQKVDGLSIVRHIMEKTVTRQQASQTKKPLPKKDEIDFNDIVSLENSEDEEEDIPEIIQTTIEIPEGSNSRVNYRGILHEGKRLSENAKTLATFLAPDPVKVFNDALVLKKSARRAPQSASNTICRFDSIITNDYVSTFFDNNVILKLYYELELFIKSLLYKNFDKVLSKISFYSDEYKKILNTDRQRDNFNLHYHNEEALPDINTLLFPKNQSNNLGDTKIITKDTFSLNEEEVKRSKFLNFVLPQNRPDSAPGDQRQTEKNSVSSSDLERSDHGWLQEQRSSSRSTTTDLRRDRQLR
jgi:Asp-tRNA(Asn)/Glu-tRNA(Gln) amidotransferase C subunit